MVPPPIGSARRGDAGFLQECWFVQVHPASLTNGTHGLCRVNPADWQNWHVIDGF